MKRARVVVVLLLAFAFAGTGTGAMADSPAADSPVTKDTLGWQ
ncbi:hypothetical protein ACIQRS_15635 [Streptomyces termitum]|uniref:Uncharacterized protein n=1 Tax=Streptomyces termitum TaxID=67368 RepID=A0A918T5Z3_9ACTN|nr:hypothetical protein [Streptomyces termitum]GHA98903.1 hypothetical protein GCM10010305_48060 [Streptomyces termitum]